MSLRAFFQELKSETPRYERAEKWMRYAGYGCLAAAVWNCGFGLFADVGALPRHWYPGLAVLTGAGLAFILSALALARRQKAGTWLGQLGIVLLLAVMLGFMYSMIIVPGSPTEPNGAGEAAPPSAFKAFFGIFIAFVFLQFAFPGVMVIKYLERLKSGGGSASPPIGGDAS